MCIILLFSMQELYDIFQSKYHFWKHKMIHSHTTPDKDTQNIWRSDRFLFENHSMYIPWKATPFYCEISQMKCISVRSTNWLNDVHCSKSVLGMGIQAIGMFLSTEFNSAVCHHNAVFSHSHSYTKFVYKSLFYLPWHFWHINLKYSVYKELIYNKYGK